MTICIPIRNFLYVKPNRGGYIYCTDNTWIPVTQWPLFEEFLSKGLITKDHPPIIDLTYNMVAPGCRFQVMDARLEGNKLQYGGCVTTDDMTVLEGYRIAAVLTVEYSAVDLSNVIVNGQLSSEFADEMEKLAKFASVDIIVSQTKDPFTRSQGSHDMYFFHIVGDDNSTMSVEIRLRVLVATFAGQLVDYFEVPSVSTIPLMGGIDYANLKNLAHSNGVSVFLPNSFANDDKVFLTSTSPAMLTKSKTTLVNLTRVEYFMKEIPVPLFKIYHLQQYDKLQLSNLMAKYGVYIDLGRTIRVQGSSQLVIDMAIRDLLSMLTQLFECELYIHTGEKNGDHYNCLPMTDISHVLAVASLSNTVIRVDPENKSFLISGDVKKVIKAVSLICSAQFNILSRTINEKVQCTYHVSLSLEHKDFILGKKNGKIMKIKEATQCSLHLGNESEYMLEISVTGESINDANNGVQMLRDELPIEQSFFIPESYHKPVIGVGGSVIQQIMRKYNVFIKFSNTWDLPANALAHVRYDNVVIRCPTKNTMNMIQQAAEQLNRCAEQHSATQPSAVVKLSRSHYRLLVENTSVSNSFVTDIERSTMTYINFPFEEPVDYHFVEIRGNDALADDAAKMLVDMYPKEYEFKVSLNQNFINVINDKNEIWIALLQRLGFESLAVTSQSYHSIILSYTDSDLLDDATQMVTSFLRDNGFMIMDRGDFKMNYIIKSVNSSPLLDQIRLAEQDDYGAGFNLQYPEGYASPDKQFFETFYN